MAERPDDERMTAIEALGRWRLFLTGAALVAAVLLFSSLYDNVAVWRDNVDRALVGARDFRPVQSFSLAVDEALFRLRGFLAQNGLWSLPDFFAAALAVVLLCLGLSNVRSRASGVTVALVMAVGGFAALFILVRFVRWAWMLQW